MPQWPSREGFWPGAWKQMLLWMSSYTRFSLLPDGYPIWTYFLQKILVPPLFRGSLRLLLGSLFFLSAFFLLFPRPVSGSDFYPKGFLRVVVWGFLKVAVGNRSKLGFVYFVVRVKFFFLKKNVLFLWENFCKSIMGLHDFLLHLFQ